MLELTERLMAARSRASELERGLDEGAEPGASPGARGDLLDATLEQARVTLARHGEVLDSVQGAPAERLGEIFTRASALLRRFGSVHTEAGSFFDARGVQVEGTILHFGRIAALGSAAGAGGVLAPTGSGGLELVGPEHHDTVRRVLKGEAPELLELFLFDPLTRSSPAAPRQAWRETLERGGLLVWPILGLGALACLLFVERVVALLLLGGGGAGLVREVAEAARTRRWQVAERLVAHRTSSIARVLHAALRHRDSPRTLFEDAVGQSLLHETGRMERILPALQVIAGVAPLLGLLGTVTGMIATFDVITEHGTGDPKLLSGGISEALITTELGLMVAVPALLLHALLAGRVERLVSTMESGALDLSVALGRSRQAEPAPEPAGAECPGRGS